MRHATIIALCLLAHGALAQQQSASKPEQKRDDLDVTMQIIVDPDAKLPDEVVRRIPLPERKSAAQQPAASPGQQGEESGGKLEDGPVQDQERAREAQELGREVSQAAQERAREVAEEREQARRAEAEERRRNNDNQGRPDDPPGQPPGRPPRD